MRIHTLTFTGVGPYRDRQHIDFDELKNSGLYLINGPTGAGKSTIIDAIVFALYGRLSGDASDESRLRSDFAAPTDATEVELVFETADGTFRVIRRPRYMRAQKRAGDALTPENAICKVFRVHVDGSETEVAKNIASAKSELQNIMGLTADQFLQTVVLPQGQFATFLRAKTVERAEILKKIFGTRLYERVAELLKEDARAARAAKDAATAALRETLVAIDAQVMLDAEAKQQMLELIHNNLDDSLLAALAAIEPDLAAVAGHLATEAQSAADDFGAADSARTLARREAEAVALAATTASRLQSATVAVQIARTPVDAAAALASSLGIAVDTADDEPTWRGRATSAATAAGALQSALEAERAVAAWPTTLASLSARIEELQAQAKTDAARIDELPALILSQQEIVATRPKADEVEALVQLRQDLVSADKLFGKIDAELAKQPVLEVALRSATMAAGDAGDAYTLANRHFIDGLAATLAAELQAGQPCPVCGSKEHPRPATPDADWVTKEQVEVLEAAARTARDHAVKADEALQHSLKVIAELEAQITISREALVAAQGQCERDEQALNTRTAAAAHADQTLSDLREEQQKLSEAAATLKTDAALAGAELTAKSKAYGADRAKAESGRGTFESVAARKRAIEALGAHLGALADALRDLAEAARAAQAATTTLASLERHDGFADTEVAESEYQAAAKLKAAADEKSREASKRLKAFRDGVNALEDGCARRAQLVAGNANLIHLADMFNPGRGADSGLHIYVLQSLFANVVEAANLRFETLLGGRFRLVPTRDEEGDARTTLGLGLAVHDGLTGKMRPATSMSGGEIFCASLALALGLADVVRTGAGGIEIGSLFIDEGFGSLDPKPLEDVMTMLRQLGSHGRLVGLISHVPEMKTAIAEKISVIQAGENQPTRLEVSWM